MAGRQARWPHREHAHARDHIGANGRLQRERAGLPIRAHPLALPVLADPRANSRCTRTGV